MTLTFTFACGEVSRSNERIMQWKNVVMNHAHMERLPNMSAKWGVALELCIGVLANRITVKYQAEFVPILKPHISKGSSPNFAFNIKRI